MPDQTIKNMRSSTGCAGLSSLILIPQALNRLNPRLLKGHCGGGTSEGFSAERIKDIFRIDLSCLWYCHRCPLKAPQ
jgi:hypothetical protein